MSIDLSGGGQKTTQKRPSWTRPGDDWLAQGLPPNGMNIDQMNQVGGYLGDVGAQQMFPYQQLFAGLPQLTNQANMGGDILRQMAGPATQMAMGAGYDLAGMGMQGANQMGAMLGLAPQFLSAANQFGQGINQAQQQYGNAFSAANQTLGNVMSPTAYNPMYQNAYQNQILPNLSASFASRGLGGGGEGIQAEMEAQRDLSNDFATRQFGEQLQAQQGLGNLAQGAGQLGVQASQVPGAILGQFMNAGAMGQQGLNQAAQLQSLPLQMAGLGGGLFQQGLDMPFNMANNMFNLTRTPMNNFGNFLNNVPNVSSSHRQSGILGFGFGG